MRSGFAMILLSFGIVCLAAGMVVFILSALGNRFGTPHPTAVPLMLGFIVAGVVLLGGSLALRRSNSSSTPKVST